MTVFISWSGDRSKAIAHVFKKHLEYVIQGLPTFMSDKDIASGAQWFQEINDKLHAASFGIVCVTPENLEKPWLSFEAGALGNQASKSRVVPVVFGMSKENLPSPLNGFHAVDLDEEGLVKLIHSIHEAREVTTNWDIIETAARREWPAIQTELNGIPEPTAGADPAPSFDIEGAVKEMRGLLRDLVDRRDARRVDAEAIETASDAAWRREVERRALDAEGLSSAPLLDPIQADLVRRRARLIREHGVSPGLASELSKPSLGLVATINGLLNDYLHGDESARAGLLKLGVDPESTSPLRDHIADRIAAIQRDANTLEDDQKHAD
jgi:hypothetical protein